MSAHVHPRALFRILSQIRFGTVLNVAGSLANPALPRYGVRGVHSRRLVVPVAEAMKEIGYVRALVFHGATENGARGMDEISTLGDTFVAELSASGEITTYTVKPEDFDLERPSEEVIRPDLDRQQEALSFVKLLASRDHGPRYDIVCLNAAPIFYLSGHARSLPDGFARAAENIKSGCALAKLREWVMVQNQDPAAGVSKLELLLEGIDTFTGKRSLLPSR
jgi:anthranilate phosphoribosyltransferase